MCLSDGKIWVLMNVNKATTSNQLILEQLIALDITTQE